MSENPTMNKRRLRATITSIKKHKDAIAKHRDALREILDDLEGVVNETDEGLLSLDNAVEALSRFL